MYYVFTPDCELVVYCSLPSAIGEGAGAHVCIPYGPSESLQASLEVCCGAPCFLPPAGPRPEGLSPLWVYPHGLTFQIQVSMLSPFLHTLFR